MILILNIELILVMIRLFIQPPSCKSIINRLILANGLLLLTYALWPDGISWDLQKADRIVIVSIAGFITILTLIFRHRKAEAFHPLPRKLLIYEVFSWLIYIYCYELFFRGFLLFSVADNWGLYIAALVNLALYAGIHAIKDEREFRWSIPFGIVLIASSIWSQSFIPAFVIHATLSITVLLQDQLQDNLKLYHND